MKKTYVGFQELGYKRNQNEYTSNTPLLDEKGNLLCSGWARKNLFEYDRKRTRPRWRGKEWDYYQVSDGNYMLEMSIANISIGGYASATLIDLKNKKVLATAMDLWLLGKNNPKHILPPKGDVPNVVDYKNGNVAFFVDTRERERVLHFEGIYKKEKFVVNLHSEIMEGLENITTVLPFKKKNGKPNSTRYFMTTKQNCMPTTGEVKLGDRILCSFDRNNAFLVLDWGRVCTPYHLVWYWGNGSTFITDENGEKHLFGFEITWGIGDEDNGTETAIFYDGKLHKFGSVDVEVFPKPDKYMEKWHFISEDNRFDMTMTPTFDYHTDTNALVARMHVHKVSGLWNGRVVLDDGKVLEIKDMFAFTEYCENRW